jgi:regulator of sigma E protease
MLTILLPFLLKLLIFFAVLSLLIFVHELGHFAAAKLCGIYVKRFSIGMPPRVIGLQVGETDYCIGAIPFGGFVMMAGQEDVPLSEDEREKEYGGVPEHRWFMNRPVWQRLLVLVMGPLMNLVLAVVLYAVIAVVGAEVPESEVVARVGDIAKDSPAASVPMFRMNGDAVPELTGAPDATGWQTGDLIVSVDAKPISNIQDLAMAAVLNGPGTLHDVVIEREIQTGKSERLFSRVAPAVIDESKRPRFGVASFDTVVVAEVSEGSPAAAAGLQKGDIVRKAAGRPIPLVAFFDYFEKLPEGGEATLEIERDGAPMTITVKPGTVGRILGLAAFGEVDGNGAEIMDRGVPVVRGILPELGQKTGIKRKDSIVEANGQPATPQAFRELVEKNPGGTLELKIARPAVMFGLIQKAETKTVSVAVDAVRDIGMTPQPRTVFKRYSLTEAVPRAWQESWLAVSRTVLTLKGLVLGAISPKDLGGPLMIYDVTTKAAEAGWDWLVRITAFISVNLFVFNLLPLPVLDGGQVVINVIESVRRKPLSEAFLVRFQQVGIVMILALMVYVTFNDVVRKVTEMIP